MKTIKYQEIENLKIVSGFDILPGDPVLTGTASNPLIEALPEFVELQTKIREREQHFTKMMEARGKVKLILAAIAEENNKEKPDKILLKNYEKEFLKQDTEYKSRQGSAETCNSELKEINSRFEPAARAIKQKNIVYCEPRKNEIVTDLVDEIMQAYLGKSENEQIVVDDSGDDVVFSTIEDFRGKQYFYKDSENNWIESEIISRLGDTVNTVVVDEYQGEAIEKNDLTPEQLEEIRLQNLSAEDKSIEYDARIDSLAADAALMKSKIEIQGVSTEDATAQAQAFYADGVAKLQEIYGVE